MNWSENRTKSLPGVRKTTLLTYFYFWNLFLVLINLTRLKDRSENIPYYMFIFLFVFRLNLQRHKSETFFPFSCWKLATLYSIPRKTELYGNFRLVLCHSRVTVFPLPLRQETLQYFRKNISIFLDKYLMFLIKIRFYFIHFHMKFISKSNYKWLIRVGWY